VGEERYLSYLLRLWETTSGRERIWRASLEIPGLQGRRGFATLQELFEFIEEQTRRGPYDLESGKKGENDAKVG
jgi:hypothetical protein